MNRTITLAALIAVLLAGCAGTGAPPAAPNPTDVYQGGPSSCADCRK